MAETPRAMRAAAASPLPSPSQRTLAAAELVDIDEIQARLSALRDRERREDAELRQLLGQSQEVEARMSSLQRLLPRLTTLYNDSRSLSEIVGSTCALAENVSSKVKELDLAKGRLQDTIKRVDDIIDLKNCVDGAQECLQSGDHEQAAWHIHRFLSFDRDTLKSDVCAEIIGSDQSAIRLLESSKDSLTQIINDKFDAAVQANDAHAIMRYFKLFPLIGLHEQGLRKYSRHLCTKIGIATQDAMKHAFRNTERGRRGHVELLTSLFEMIAKTVEHEEPIIETQYGPGRVMFLVEILQHECDVQATKILQQFLEDRDFDHKLDAIKMTRHGAANAPNANPVDPRELDMLLTELTAFMGRTSLYFRFLQRRIDADTEILLASRDEKSTGPPVDTQAFDKLLRKSELHTQLQMLTGHYITMEEFFLKSNISKAMAMDTQDSGSKTSTVVDDAFYLMSKCSRRAMSSASVNCACAMLNHISNTLLTEYLNHFKPALDSGPASFGTDLAAAFQTRLQAGLNSIQQGKKLSLAAPNEAELNARFLLVLNNLQTSNEYAIKLMGDLAADANRAFSSSKQSEKIKLESVLSDLGATANSFKTALQRGLEILCSTAIDPRIKPLADAMQTVSYELTEDHLASYDVNSPFMSSFIVGLQGILAAFQPGLLPEVNDALVAFVTEQAAQELERVVLLAKFNRLGGVQFDRDLRTLISFLSGSTAWTVRDKFARLSQVATLLNLDQVTDITDYWGSNSGSLTWQLTPTEVRRVLARRVDFRSEEINKLRL